jgi:small subunit ribosomal protein S17
LGASLFDVHVYIFIRLQIASKTAFSYHSLLGSRHFSIIHIARRFLRRHASHLAHISAHTRRNTSTMSSLAFSAGAVMGTRVSVKTAAVASTRRAPVAVTAKQVLEGKVVSTAMDKSAVLMVERKVPHPRYHKLVKKSTKFTFHDEANACVVGDVVRVEACRPMSKSKKFTLLEKVQK